MKYLSIGLAFLFLFEIIPFGGATAEEHGKVIIVSSKLGEVIDVEERDRYALFPQIKGFKSAVFLRLSDNSIVAEVTYEKNGEEKIIRIPQSEIDIITLADYIEKVSKGKIQTFSLADGAKTEGKLVSVSGKVGVSIDLAERNEYEIFMNIPNFELATFYSIKEGGFLIEIQTKNDTLISVVKDKTIVIILRDYIERYEEIQVDRKSFEEKWSIIYYDEQGMPITENEILSKKGSFCALGCALTGGAATGLLAGLSTALAYMDRTDNPPVVIPMFVGVILGGVIGYSRGSRFDELRINRGRAIEQIRKSRAPK